MLKSLVYASLLVLAFRGADSDIYLHNPRGSNNRLDGNNRNRNNANRLFDSQNNDRGGYNVGNLYYFVDSELAVEWTNQHSCGDQNNHCEIVIQYMCSDMLRDGISEGTIPDNPAQCENNDCNSDLEYGMHEDFYYYAHCKLRTRNGGLFTADRNLKGDKAKYTRQNNNGNRFGYECPEERDYYPYWGPTPWKDIAILTNDVKRCPYYQTESQNVKSRFECEVPYQYLYMTKENQAKEVIPIDKEKCEAFEVTLPDGTVKAGVWKERAAHDIPAPACLNTIFSRDNHLGNTFGGNPATFNWTVIDSPHHSCAMRIRYNISTADYDGWNTTEKSNNRIRKDGLGPDMWRKFNLSEDEAETRQYYLKNNPSVDVFNTTGRKKSFTLQLAVNMAQYGRTFEDRTHRFKIETRTPDLENAKIRNLNVRGKRGNIVQVYPAVEYDFVPNTLQASVNDYVHVQWTGSNDNPANNDGQGRASTDRSNIVAMKERAYPEGDPLKAQKDTYGHAGTSYPSNVSQDFAGFSVKDHISLASLDIGQLGGVMDELDDAGTYFDLGPRRVTMTGNYNYMCTRNNNFSNRSQKGKLVVKTSRMESGYIGERGGNITITGTETSEQTMISIPPDSLAVAQVVQLEEYADGEVPVKTEPPNQDYVSNFVLVSLNAKTDSENPMTVRIALKSGAAVGTLFEPEVFRSVNGDTWISIEVDSENSDSSIVQFQTDSGGHFVTSKRVAAGPMAGLVIGCVVAVVIIVALTIYCKTTKLPLASYSSKV